MRKLDSIIDGKCLHELESNTTARQILVRICGICTLRIQNGNSRWHNVIWDMVVTYNEIDSFFFGISNLLDSFNATIQDDNQFYS